jgi:hypothetical protein
MEALPGATYLFNLSLLAITFAAVTALLMLVRQTMGGKLSNFDVYLIASHISFGFGVTIASILPPMFSLFEQSSAMLWAISSGLAAVLLGGILANVVNRRREISPEPMSRAVILRFAIHALIVVLLLVDAAPSPLQGAGLFATALTLSLVNTMWAFVGRISSLLGDKAGDDWDPKRG